LICLQYFGVFFCVIGFLNPSTDDPNSCIIIFPNSNSNGNPFVDSGLLSGAYNFTHLNTAKASCVTTFSIYNSVAYRPSCLYYCWYCKFCSKCCGLAVVSIQSSSTFPSKCKCSSPSKNLVSCSFLTSWLYSFSCLSCGDVICGTSYLCSLGYLSCGDVIAPPKHH
jgi:hypothetical protein